MMGTISFLRDLSLLIGICYTIYSVDSWRREHIGKRKIELAEDVLTLFYEARDAIKYMRSPFASVSEYSVIERSPNETEEQWHARQNASVVFKRYNDHKELFSKIYAMRYRFMVQIGPNETKPFEDLNKIIHDILGAARVLARLWPRDHFRTEEEFNEHWKKIEKYEAVFWEGNPEEDPINPRLDETIGSIEKICREIITGKGTLYSFINWPFCKRN